jgi:hypothetical protein
MEPSTQNEDVSRRLAVFVALLCYVRGPEGIIVELAEKIG